MGGSRISAYDVWGSSYIVGNSVGVRSSVVDVLDVVVDGGDSAYIAWWAGLYVLDGDCVGARDGLSWALGGFRRVPLVKFGIGCCPVGIDSC